MSESLGVAVVVVPQVWLVDVMPTKWKDVVVFHGWSPGKNVVLAFVVTVVVAFVKTH
jgi:hypothetical protein